MRLKNVLLMNNSKKKDEENDANFSDKISISLREKKQYLENTKKNCILKNMRFILGDFRSNICSYFFSFLHSPCKIGIFFCHQGPLTNVKMSKFCNLENHVFLDQI